jgi:GTP-binding protein LepA
MPDPTGRRIEEPWIQADDYVPDEYLGPISRLCRGPRGIRRT